MATVQSWIGGAEVERRTFGWGAWRNTFWVWDNELLSIVLETVHPGNLGALPPEPEVIASLGVFTGLVKSRDELQGRKVVRCNGHDAPVAEYYAPGSHRGVVL